jgi:hypothetical protein
MKRSIWWAVSGSTSAIALSLVLVVTHGFVGCGSGQCDGECPAGQIPDSTGCLCLLGGRTCDPNNPQPVQDGGAMLADCCPQEALQSTSRATPAGACTGRQQCFVAVHQVCTPGAPSTDGPVDKYNCVCDSANWQCSLTSSGAGLCPNSDAGTSD